MRARGAAPILPQLPTNIYIRLMQYAGWAAVCLWRVNAKGHNRRNGAQTYNMAARMRPQAVHTHRSPGIMPRARAWRRAHITAAAAHMATPAYVCVNPCIRRTCVHRCGKQREQPRRRRYNVRQQHCIQLAAHAAHCAFTVDAHAWKYATPYAANLSEKAF